MRRRAKRGDRYLLWWWLAAVGAVISMLVLQSGAFASRQVDARRWPDVDAMMRARDSQRVEPQPEDAGLLRQRYEALGDRRRRIEEALPRRLTARPGAERAAVRSNGAVEPPRMDSGAGNPDGLIILPRGGDGSAGGER